MFCKNCGKEIPDQSPKCPACGASQTITELEYRTGSKTHAGAAMRKFLDHSRAWQALLILEGLKAVLGFAAILFALLSPDETFLIGHRAILALLGGTILLNAGASFCRQLLRGQKPEV